MKKKLFIVLLLIGSILFNPIIAFASAYVNDATEMNITINNIYDDYDKILIMKDGSNIELESIADELGIQADRIIDNTIFTYVPPFEEEDFKFENKLKDKYTITYDISYSYDFENSGYGSYKKYKNVEDFILHNYLDADEAIEIRMHPEKIKCQRSVSFTIDVLEEVDIATPYITRSSGSSVTIKLTDFSFLNSPFDFNHQSGTLLYIRFVKSDGTHKDFKIDSKIVTTYGHNATPEDLIVNYVVNYKTGVVVNANKDPIGAVLSNPFTILFKILYVILMAVLMSYVELSIFAVNKKKELLIWFILINLAFLSFCMFFAHVFGQTKERTICFMIIAEMVFHISKLEIYRLSIKAKKYLTDNVLASVLISIAILIFSILLYKLIF